MTTSTMTVQQAVALARQHHQAGQLSEAESLYREILAVEPNQPEAMHALGLLAFQSGMHDAALHFLRRAVAVNPMSAATFADLGRVLAATGRRDEAVVAYRSALQLDPQSPQTHIHLANALLCLDILDEAINEYRQAIALKWDFAEAYNNLGHALRNQGKQDEAIASFRCALRIKPRLADAHYNLGLSLRQCGEMTEAIAEFRAALDCRSNYPEAWNNLGGTLLEQKEYSAAIDAFYQALALRPNFPESLTNLGNALRATGQLEQSIASIQQALTLKPNYPCGLNSLGSSLHSTGRFDEAMDAYRKAIALRQDWAVPHCNLAFTLLLKGDFAQGWPEHEWRLESKDLDGKQTFDLPRWDGSNLAGKRIVLHTEQGFGDAIQFCRYVPLVAEMGGRIIVRCQPELVCLMKNIPGVEEVISTDDPLPPDVQLHCPLLSLPLIFKTDVSAIPAAVPYLSANPNRSTAWRTQLQNGDAKLKVGLVWAGRAGYLNDRNRTLSLDALSSLGDVAGVSFISLQKGEAGTQADGTPAAAKMRLIDCGPDLQTFADTAALIDELDLVITVDTAVAHLAGAMGKQVWVLLPFVPDWRWMLNRTDSPWYPSMTLFRQPRIGDWQTPIDQIAGALRRLAAGA